MANVNTPNYPEHRGPVHRGGRYRQYFSWKAIFVGLLVTLLSFLTFTSLGIGIGGLALSDLEGIQAFGWSAAAWIIITAMISLFVGSFLATRVFNLISSKTGAAQGVTIAAVFFMLSLWSGGLIAGFLGQTAASVGRGVATVAPSDMSGIAGSIIQNPEVRSYLNEQARELGVQPDQVDTVASGLAQRIASGDTEAAKSYLAQQTNLTREQIDARLDEMRSEVIGSAGSVAETSARAVSAAGWYGFFMLVLGTGAAVFGGISGVRRRTTV